MFRRTIGVIAGVALVAAAAMASVASAGSAVAARPAARVAIATPDIVFASRAHFGQIPTTAQCIKSAGVACYRPSQFQEAYNLRPLYKEHLNGAGRTIIIADSFGSPTIESDLATFDQLNHLPAPPHFTILTPEGAIPPYNPNSVMFNWAFETSLDVEYSHAIAPGADIVLLETPVAETEGVEGFPQLIAAENYAISHHLGDVITQSFGATEQTFPNANAIMKLRSAYIAAAAAGITVLASSGDTGASNYHHNGVDLYTKRVVGWPSSDPLVTSVGGLQLHLNQRGDAIAPANVWNDTATLGELAVGSGGASSVFARPPYQNGVRGTVGSWRGTPDISLSAAVNGGALVYGSFGGLPGPGFYIVGGTSEASPEMAGIVAIADQAAGHDLGNINPTLYSLEAAGAPGIVDITNGENSAVFTQHDHTYTVPGFLAIPGYDMASGVGGINAAELVPELAGNK